MYITLKFFCCISKAIAASADDQDLYSEATCFEKLYLLKVANYYTLPTYTTYTYVIKKTYSQ